MARRTGPPAYITIENHLRRQIAGSSPGDPLPSDKELSATFAVSRMTARQAVSQLANEGLLYRVAGSGTYVAERQLHRRVNRLLSFTEHSRRFGKVASARVLHAEVRRGSRQENVDLRQRPQDKVVALRRLRFGDDSPVAIENVVLPGGCASVLEGDLVNGSLHEMLTALGRGPARSRGNLTALPASPEEAKLLDVAIGAALIVQRHIIADADGSPVELAEVHYVGERFVFDIDQEKHVIDPTEHAAQQPYQVRGVAG